MKKIIRRKREVAYAVPIARPIRWFLRPIHWLNIPLHILSDILERIIPKNSPFGFVSNRVFIRFVVGSVVLFASFFWENPHWLHHAVYEYGVEFVRAAGVTPIVDGFLVLLKVAEEVV